MSDSIRFADGTEFRQPALQEAPVHTLRVEGREWRRIHISGSTVEEVKAKFTDNADYAHVWDSLLRQSATDRAGRPLRDTQGRPAYVSVARQESEDLSAYSVAGDIVDTRDGNIIVYMGRPTQLEQAYELLYGGDGYAQ